MNEFSNFERRVEVLETVLLVSYLMIETQNFSCSELLHKQLMKSVRLTNNKIRYTSSRAVILFLVALPNISRENYSPD